MKAARLGLLTGVLATLLVPAPATAHHAIAAKFDERKPVTLKGFVTKVDWLNPHVHIFINVPDGRSTTNWAIELESPVELQKGGWTRDSLKPGDAITVQGISAIDESSQAWARSVVLTASGKKILDTPGMQPSVPRGARQPVPRWPDGQPRLGPPPGETGFWVPDANALVENRAKISVDSHGLLRNLADVDKVAPFQRWARDLYELRQRNQLRDDPLFLYCMPPGGPRQFQIPYGVQFVEDRDRKRIFVLMGGGNHNYRIIYTDGRAQIGQLQGDYDNPLYYGRAVASWDKDTLVVDTKGFNDQFWFANGGLPHTDQLHLIERLSRTDLNTLEYEVTIDDPGAYLKPWTTGWTLRWVSGEELPPYYCEDNRP